MKKRGIYYRGFEFQKGDIITLIKPPHERKKPQIVESVTEKYITLIRKSGNVFKGEKKFYPVAYQFMYLRNINDKMQ